MAIGEGVTNTLVVLMVFAIVWCQTAFSANGEMANENKYYYNPETFLHRYENVGESLLVSVNIWGQVENPGKYKVPDGTDVVSLISYAGGPNEYASLGKVKLSRPSPSGGEYIEVDVGFYLENPEPGSIPVLKPGDTIYVPKNSKYAWKTAVEIVAQVAVITSTALLIYSIAEED
jgi:hypothetical protein